MTVTSPADHVRRGGNVSFKSPGAGSVVEALIDAGVVSSFRKPDAIRFGVSPLVIRHVDIFDAVAKLRTILKRGHLDAACLCEGFGMTPHPINGPNPFKLGIFSANADGGLTLTTVKERWAARWSDVAKVAQLADRAGIEFFLPIARWKGFEGTTNSREHSFETFTFAAAIAAITEKIGVFSTIHVPMIHPVYAAKALATVDNVSEGRAGLNIVAGWNPDEFAMFGIDAEAERYAQALEWYEIICKIYNEPARFDYDGALLQAEGRFGETETRAIAASGYAQCRLRAART